MISGLKRVACSPGGLRTKVSYWLEAARDCLSKMGTPREGALVATVALSLVLLFCFPLLIEFAVQPRLFLPHSWPR